MVEGVTIDAAVIIVLVLQFAGLVWGAAKLSSAVAELRKIAEATQSAVVELHKIVSNHETRLSVLEDRDDRDGWVR